MPLFQLSPYLFVVISRFQKIFSPYSPHKSPVILVRKKICVYQRPCCNIFGLNHAVLAAVVVGREKQKIFRTGKVCPIWDFPFIGGKTIREFGSLGVQGKRLLFSFTGIKP